MASGLDQLLGALGEEFEAFEAEERSAGSEAGEESGTDRQCPSGRGQGTARGVLTTGRGALTKRGRGGRGVAVGRGAAAIAGTSWSSYVACYFHAYIAVCHGQAVSSALHMHTLR